MAQIRKEHSMKTIWESDGTDGPVLICLPPEKKEQNMKDTETEIELANEVLRLTELNSDILFAVKFAEGVMSSVFDAVHDGVACLKSNAQVLVLRQARDMVRKAIAKSEGIIR